jgi:hypothetical protein
MSFAEFSSNLNPEISADDMVTTLTIWFLFGGIVDSGDMWLFDYF